MADDIKTNIFKSQDFLSVIGNFDAVCINIER